MYRNLSEEEKEVKTDHGRNRYRNMKEKQAKKMMKKYIFFFFQNVKTLKKLLVPSVPAKMKALLIREENS